MKKCVAILLLFALTAQCFNQLRIIAYYQLNKAYIAKVLCINRDKPSMHCDGKCYLKRQLQNDTETEKNVASNLRGLSETVIFCETISPVNLSAESITGDHAEYFSAALLPSHSRSIFHPPAC